MTIKLFIADLTIRILRVVIRLIGPAAAAYLAERLPLTARVRVAKQEIAFCSSNTALLFRARTVLTKEPETIEWINSFTAGCCIWDIGANVGVYSLYAALHRGATVLAFEPSAANFQALNANVELNEASESVLAYCLAFAQTTELGTLNMTNTTAGGATNNFDNAGKLSPYATVTGRVFRQGMVGFSIDDFVAKFAPPFPDHLKIDVDGIEHEILVGASKTLADPRLQTVLIELETVDPAEYQECVSMLTSAGLTLTGQGELQAVGTSLRPRNHIFKRRDS